AGSRWLPTTGQTTIGVLGTTHPRTRGQPMRIAVKGRNVSVTDAHREQVQRRFRRIARQVSALAQLEVELREERNPAIADKHVVEATLELKGVTLRARASSADMLHA